MSGICTVRSPPFDAGSLRGARVLVFRSVVLRSGPLRKNGLDDILAHKEASSENPRSRGAIRGKEDGKQAMQAHRSTLVY